MQESKLLGKLLPTSPDFLPIVRQLREKYGLPELAPLDDFREGVRFLVQSAPERFPPQLAW